jgi:hypothetical protein
VSINKDLHRIIADVERLQDAIHSAECKNTELKVYLSEALEVISEYAPGFTVLIESIKKEVG